MSPWRRVVPLIDPARGPIVAGGLGGSGTRVVAEMMRHLDVYTGTDLNKAGDNKWFTLLCKLPRWDLDQAAPEASLVARSLDILERAMTGQLVPRRRDRRAIAAVVARCTEWWCRDPLPDDRPDSWLEDRAASLRDSRRHTPEGAELWGWKEPNSHLLLGHLQGHFGDRLRYVHVIRHGVYMTQSPNQAQVRRWGSNFGLVEGLSSPNPVASLDFWIRANDLAIRRGQEMSGRFLLVNYDDLCAAPRENVIRFVEFLGLDPPQHLLEKLVSLPNRPRPPSPISPEMSEQFGEERLARVRELGFSTDSY